MLARHRIEDDPQLASALGLDRLASTDDLQRQRRTDYSRQPLRATPAGEEPDLNLREAELRLRTRARQPDLESKDHPQPPAHTRAIDGCYRGKRQRLDRRDQIEPALNSGSFLLLIRARHGQFTQVRPGDEHA